MMCENYMKFKCQCSCFSGNIAMPVRLHVTQVYSLATNHSAIVVLEAISEIFTL
jgi:hypothetical protein